MQEKVKVRDRILHVATDLFYHQGFNQTGINQIIAEADIAIGSLYNHFPSKNDLLLAYLQRQEDELFEGFEQAIKGVTHPRDKVLKFIDYRIAQQQSSGFCGCPFTKIISEIGDRDPKVQQLVQSHKEKQRTMLYGFIKQMEYTGSLDRKLLADTLFLMLEGATISTTIHQNIQALESVKKYLKKISD
ncbi:TetR/AcrR family transcriptional regulator [Chitinophaga nivalis]|uniref:TetR/AcrR family transcriptional regulator n=1 Tax=Chitinophaga nivalis TaxID=2991709 RepID=A0ABT3IJZ9_9BACT|nr:TetR/AcrR family transcriptional regulator [Chitinophaga nivalis]MCW3466027.1 TetR/AcrR family transcriptional regulator [Chitinophaga nivalis]MCW3484282.1 TetR/AcrR family transcriptional regulator [Chitinophaga nivalis]